LFCYYCYYPMDCDFFRIWKGIFFQILLYYYYQNIKNNPLFFAFSIIYFWITSLSISQWYNPFFSWQISIIIIKIMDSSIRYGSTIIMNSFFPRNLSSLLQLSNFVYYFHNWIHFVIHLMLFRDNQQIPLPISFCT